MRTNSRQLVCVARVEEEAMDTMLGGGVLGL